MYLNKLTKYLFIVLLREASLDEGVNRLHQALGNRLKLKFTGCQFIRLLLICDLGLSNLRVCFRLQLLKVA